MIRIIDYGVGNIASIENMLRKVGAPVGIGRTEAELRGASHLILPGVGAFDHGMSSLRARGLEPVLSELVRERGIPILGICLGMQLLAQRSEEGSEPGLGWLDAECVRFSLPTTGRLKVPHMGWNTVSSPPGAPNPLLPEDARFYFVHSYHIRCHDAADVAGTTTYGYPFTAAVRRGNITGVQFHPEKSHRFGLELLRRFWAGAP